jgi:hypothetical protein
MKNCHLRLTSNLNRNLFLQFSSLFLHLKLLFYTSVSWRSFCQIATRKLWMRLIHP